MTTTMETIPQAANLDANHGASAPARLTHKKAILKLLRDGAWHDTTELNAICWRYGARLFELRDEGHRLVKRRKPGTRNIEEWRWVRPVGQMALFER